MGAPYLTDYCLTDILLSVVKTCTNALIVIAGFAVFSPLTAQIGGDPSIEVLIGPKAEGFTTTHPSLFRGDLRPTARLRTSNASVM